MSAVVSRRDVDGELATAAPLLGGLPALYREPNPGAGDAGRFVRRFTDALDEVLAPVVATLDNLPAYFDPRTTPEDFLDWLAGWVGLELFEKWSPEVRRSLVADAVERHRHRGTKLGVENAVAILAEVDPEQITIEESGGVWGLAVVALDDGRFPEFPTDGTGIWMKITVAVGEERFGSAEEVRVEQLVRRVAERLKPAHVALADVVVSA